MSLTGKEPILTTGTHGQKLLHRVLSDIGFIVEDELAVGRYAIDCYVGEVHLGFEFDGADFHASVQQRLRDEERDSSILNDYGIALMRVVQDELTAAHRPELIDRIKAFVEGHADDLDSRRKIWKSHRGF